MYSIQFHSGTTHYYPNGNISELDSIVTPEQSIIITDENIFQHYQQKLKAYKVLTIAVGEDSKQLTTIETLAQQLLENEISKMHTIIGFGGGVVTDMVGLLASVYMRGARFGFVPTSLLAMVDASAGGKNGVNVGNYKNMLGVVAQPSFIFYDYSLLKTLEEKEWINAFAEIIKYALIRDELLLEILQHADVHYFKKNPAEIISRCVQIKNELVFADENDSGIRRLLNFGHTAGHAFERSNNIPHGEAVALGMIVACMLSEKFSGLNSDITLVVKKLLQQYLLPASLHFDEDAVMNILKRDKKRNANAIDYILLEKPGSAVVKQVDFHDIFETLKRFKHEGAH